MASIKRAVRRGGMAFNVKAVVALAMAAVCAGCATAPDQKAVAVHHPAVVDFASCAKPVYPRAEIAAGHAGTVSLRFLIGVDGYVHDSLVVKSSGYRELDQAAMVGLARCHFKPATKDGAPVDEWVPIQYVWSMT
jgi:TonB family protein